jgi:hypothetical protein
MASYLSDDTVTPLANIVTSPVWEELFEKEEVVKRDSNGEKTLDKNGKEIKHSVPSRKSRRYASAITSVADYGHKKDSVVKTVVFEIAMRSFDSKAALSAAHGLAQRLDASYAVSPALGLDFQGFAKKYTNFSATFTRANLAGVVERIVRGLAMSSNSLVDVRDLCGGLTPRVQVLGTTHTPVTAASSSVFLPRLVDTVTAPSSVAVLIAAITGEGGTVVTDDLAVDLATGAPVIPSVSRDMFPAAAVDALRVLGSNMGAAGQGGLFSYAVARGVHRTVSVVGHSDEGGIVRDLLRAGEFSVPYGGIHFGLDVYCGLPCLLSTSRADVAGFVDSMALATAAVVAVSDPGLEVEGVWLPTIIDATGDDTVEDSGTHVAGDDEAGRRCLNAIMDSTPLFAARYIPNLAKLFKFEGTSAEAERHLSAAVTGISEPTRHMAHSSVAPWFWIEPTSLIPAGYFGGDAEANGCGALATAGDQRDIRNFVDFEKYGRGDGVQTAACVSMTSPRTSGLVMHMMGRRGNGLSCLKPRQMDPESIIHPGPNAQRPTVRARMAHGCGLDEYLWTRGQSPLPAPAELINVSGAMVLEAQHGTFGPGGFTALDVPTPDVLFAGTTRWSVSRPHGIRAHQSNYSTNDARRARTVAVNSLARVRTLIALGGAGGSTAVPTVYSAPPRPGGANRERNAHLRTSSVGDDIAEAPPRMVAADGPRPGGEERRTVPVGVTGKLGPVTAPTPVRGLPTQPGAYVERSSLGEPAPEPSPAGLVQGGDQ